LHNRTVATRPPFVVRLIRFIQDSNGSPINYIKNMRMENILIVSLKDLKPGCT
jgi:hypothetical protein